MRRPPPPAVTEPVTVLDGHDDWGNVLYRASAAINFAGGETSPEMTSDDEQAFYAARDADRNGVGDNFDCGGFILANGTSTFPCTHRMDTPKGIKRTGNFEVVIFSEKNGPQVWDAPAQVKQDDDPHDQPGVRGDSAEDQWATGRARQRIFPTRRPA